MYGIWSNVILTFLADNESLFAAIDIIPSARQISHLDALVLRLIWLINVPISVIEFGPIHPIEVIEVDLFASNPDLGIKGVH